MPMVHEWPYSPGNTKGLMMARRTPETWAEIRTVYETKHDIGFAELGRMYGVSGAMVGRKAKNEKWVRADVKSIESLADKAIAKPCNG